MEPLNANLNGKLVKRQAEKYDEKTAGKKEVEGEKGTKGEKKKEGTNQEKGENEKQNTKIEKEGGKSETKGKGETENHVTIKKDKHSYQSCKTDEDNKCHESSINTTPHSSTVSSPPPSPPSPASVTPSSTSPVLPHITNEKEEKETEEENGKKEEQENDEDDYNDAAEEEELDNKQLEEAAEKYKEEGNKEFKNGHFTKAVELYTNAIDKLDKHSDQKDTNLHTYFANRAFCNIKLENYGSAILDSEAAIALKSNFSKAYYRRGCAYFCLAKYKLALNDFARLNRLSPNDKDIVAKYNECQKIIKKERFAAAIRNENSLPPSEMISLQNIPVEDSYKGPVYDSSNLTPEFLKELIEFIKVPGNVLHKRYLYMIVLDAIKLFKTLKTMVRITVPDDSEFTICGDIHGQFYDLLNIFKLNGYPSSSNPYLFNGDFVDRGSFSLECILTLLVAKLIYPNDVHLTRGNHETQNMNKLYGFQGELQDKYNKDAKLYMVFSELFCHLPLAHLINEKIFVVHGGLFSRDGVTLKQIEEIDRNCEPPDTGLMTEMLWSDPQEALGRSPSKRGVACQFGPDVTKKFLQENKLSLVIRSHEMKEKGYTLEHGGKLITVFSAPNYCDQVGNDGAFIRLSGKDLEPRFTVFKAVEHPPVRSMKYANPFIGGFL